MKRTSCTHFALGSLLLITVLSCSSPIEEEAENETSASKQEEEVDYAPTSIVGKIITLGSNEKFYNLTSSGVCSVDYSILENVYGTPQYTYSRTNNTQATFWAQFVEKNTVYETISKTTTVYYETYTVNYTFSFTSDSEGSYSGTLTTYTPRMGSVLFPVPAKTHVYPSSGSFSMN